jgi:hypothetical protein
METAYYTRVPIDIKQLGANGIRWLRKYRSQPLISRHPLAILLFDRSAGETSLATICFLPELEVAIDLFGFPLR